MVGILEVGILPELEVRVNHPVGETFTANTDAFKHTVTGQLVHHKVRVDETCMTKLHIPLKTNITFLYGTWRKFQVSAMFGPRNYVEHFNYIILGENVQKMT